MKHQLTGVKMVGTIAEDFGWEEEIYDNLCDDLTTVLFSLLFRARDERNDTEALLEYLDGPDPDDIGLKLDSPAHYFLLGVVFGNARHNIERVRNAWTQTAGDAD